MTQRERVYEDRPGVERVATYEAPVERTNVVSTEIKPTDLVRWGPVIAGLFTALATLITLSVLGIAIGLTVFNYGDPASSFGIGAGIWGAVTALIAFFAGGLIAGRTAAFGGRASGILNGAMVWLVAIPLLVYTFGTGIGALTRTAGSIVGTAAQVAAPVAGQAAGAAVGEGQILPTAQAELPPNPAQAAQATAQAIAPNISPQDANQAAAAAAQGAWWALLSLGLAAAAAIAGGTLGARARGPATVRA